MPITLGGNAFLLKHAPNVLGCAYVQRRAKMNVSTHNNAVFPAHIM